ncbi:MAG: glycosyltransferase family 4 protein [Verrucomicrobiota bacterium]
MSAGPEEKPDETSSRILIVGQHFWPEAFRVNDIADFFIEHGFEVDVLCGMPNYPQGTFFPGYSNFGPWKEVHNAINIFRVPEIPRKSNTSLRIFLNYISYPITSLFRVPKLAKNHYDHIFIYQLSPVMMSIAGIAIGKLSKTETTMYVLDPWPENPYSVISVHSRWLRWIAKRLSHFHYKNVDKLAVLTEKMYQHFLAITDLDVSRIAIIPQTSEQVYEIPVHDTSLHERFGGNFNILYAGNISPAQSFETILATAQELKQQGIRDVHWIIVGDGMSRSWLEDQVVSLGLSDSFTFEGHQPIEFIPKYTELADVLVGCLASSEFLDATIPAKVVSYLAAGKPIVLAMNGEVSSLINDTIQCGFVGPAENSSHLTQNLMRVYRLSPIERELLGNAAKKYHKDFLSREIILDRLLDFILH